MTRSLRWRDAARWAIWLVLALSLAVAALLRGGVEAAQWQYLTVVISLATATCLVLRSRRTPDTAIPLEFWLLSALAAWMLLALVPLPPSLVSLLSPHRARWALAARAMTESSPDAWLALSVAPAATFERLLFVLPAMAMFVAAREMPRWWGGERAWITVTPVIVVAVLEATLGLAQFNSSFGGSGVPRSVSGTYFNRNHYAGLLQLAFPMALTWAVALWSRPERTFETRATRTGRRAETQPMRSAIGAGALFLAAGCILAGVIVSLSRMGFAATLAAMATVALGWLAVRGRHRGTSRWMWLLPVALPLGIVLLVSTNAMVLRFADTPGVGEITADGRVQIWRESWRMFEAYPWTGAGLGTFEHALYPFRAWMPTNAVDYAHNDYLQILTELGVLGFILTMALALRIFERSLSVALQSEERHRWLGVGLLAAFLAIGLHSVVDFNLYIPANALALAWLAGVAVSPGLREPGT